VYKGKKEKRGYVRQVDIDLSCNQVLTSSGKRRETQFRGRRGTGGDYWLLGILLSKTPVVSREAGEKEREKGRRKERDKFSFRLPQPS